MSGLVVKKIISPAVDVMSYTTANLLFIDLPWHSISNSPWQESYPYIPKTAFRITYTEQAIWLQYTVEEEFVKAQYIRPNENIWEDSCVEFFVSLDNKLSYYNFEFNPLGAGLIGYGTADKSSRRRLDPNDIERVDVYTQLSKCNGFKVWSTVWRIPLELLKIDSLSGRTLHANFYKCGDKLPQPHFLTWHPIENPTPNFHLPQYFGALRFE